MKINIAAIVGITLASSITAASNAVILANWTFEPPFADSNNTTTSPNITASGGVFGGIANGLHASAGTDWSTPVGNGSTDSFSSNDWAVGDYYQFSTSSVGFQGITIEWSQTRSGTGPATFDLSYSTDGTNFTVLTNNYTVLENIAGNGGTWNSGGVVANYNFGPTLAPGALDNQSTIWFRLVADAAPGASGGTNRVDNVVISGTAIPAPGAIALLGLAGLVGSRRRRR